MVDCLFGLFLAHKNKACFTIDQNGTIDEKKNNILKVNWDQKLSIKFWKKNILDWEDKNQLVIISLFSGKHSEVAWIIQVLLQIVLNA